MKAVIITRPGGPEVLEVQEVTTPEPVGDEVRVRVRAAGINRADLLQRAGYYPPPPGTPTHIPGLEFAGEVDAIGPQVQSWRVGQRVMGLSGGGGQAEYILTREGLLVAIPENLDFIHAAGIPEAFMTAHDALFTQARLSMGERVLIHAIGSGVGSTALQLAKAAGASVFGTSRTPAKLEQARALGLDFALSTQDFAAEIQRLTDQQGVHVVLDFVGADYLEQNLRSLHNWGRMVILATLGGTQGELPIGLLMGKRLTIKGVTLRTRTLEEKLSVTRAFATGVLPLLASGKVKPIIERVYPITEISQAHMQMEENQNFGKLIVTID